MSPRRINISQAAVNTAPAFKDVVSHIDIWNNVPFSGAGSTAYRIAGEAPIDGYLDAAYLILDNTSTASAETGRYWTITLVNAGPSGTSTQVTMTTAIKTDVTRNHLTVITFPIILTGNARKVLQGDIIALKAVQGSASNPGAFVSGLMTMQFSASRQGS